MREREFVKFRQIRNCRRLAVMLLALLFAVLLPAGGALGSTGDLQEEASVWTVQAAGGDRLAFTDFMTKVYMAPGASRQIPVKAYSASGQSKKVHFAALNPQTATVTDSGMITAHSVGIGRIRVFTSGKRKANKILYIYVTNLKYVAHAGLSENAPRNSAKAFELAGRAGFWGAECDLRITGKTAAGDYALVCSHDNNLRAMCGVNRNLSDMMPQEVKSLRIRGGTKAASYNEKICYLYNFLTICQKYGMVPFIDIKPGDYSDRSIRRICALLYRKGLLAKVRFVGKQVGTMERIRQYAEKRYHITPVLQPNYTAKTARSYKPSAWIRYMKKHRYQGISIERDLATASFLRRCRANGLAVNLWTYRRVNGKTLAKNPALASSVDSIMSEYFIRYAG